MTPHTARILLDYPVLNVNEDAMRYLSLLTCVLSSVLAQANAPMSVPAPKRTLKICYISMNNEKEFHVTKNFVDRIQSLTGKKWVEVEEFLEKGSNPEKTLESMIEKNTVCDGLVISGHHTGSFGGTRAQGHLSVEFMERVSCEKKKSKWFEAVQSLWLQGCRTLGAPGEMGEQNVNLAEFHANRVHAVRDADGLEQNQLQLAQEFSDLLDAQTPYATRFMKSFPQARLYGWTRTAPGDRAGSERSLPFHIHNMAIRSGSDMKNWIKDPFDRNMTAEQANIYLQSLMMLLQPVTSAQGIQASLKSWEDHGKPNPRTGTVGFDNDDLASMPPLFGNGDSTLPKSRALECKLRTSNTSRDTTDTINQILEDPRLIALSFYTLKDVISRNTQGESAFKSAIVAKMKNNQNLMNFLEEKLKSLHASLVRKLEYYGFLAMVDANHASQYAAKLKTQSEEALLKKPKAEGDYEQRDFKAKVLEEALKSKLLSFKDIRNFFETTNDKMFAQSILSMISGNTIYLPDDKLEQLIIIIGEAHNDLAFNLISAIDSSQIWRPSFTKLIERILERVKVSKDINTPYELGYILESKTIPEIYLNQAAQITINRFETLTKYSETDLSLAAKGYSNTRLQSSYRVRLLNIYVNKASEYVAQANAEDQKRFISHILSNSNMASRKDLKFSENEIQTLTDFFFKNIHPRKETLDGNEYGQYLKWLYLLGNQSDLLNKELKENLNHSVKSKGIFSLISDLAQSKDENFIKFDTTAIIKKLLQGHEEYYRYFAMNILFRAKIERQEFHALFDQMLRTLSNNYKLFLVLQIGDAKFLPAETKKHLTEKVLKSAPDLLQNPFYSLVARYLNPYVGSVNSNAVLKALKNDPYSLQLRGLYAAFWMQERPHLTVLPAQLDPYLRDLDQDSIDIFLFYATSPIRTLKPEVARDLYIRALELSPLSPEDLGSLREELRGKYGQKNDFKYKHDLIKKINEKLAEHYE